MQTRWMVAAGVVAAALGLLEGRAGAGNGGHGHRNFEVVHEFVSGVDIPESVTADSDGNFYISVGNTLQRLSPGGTLSTFATLPLPVFALGVKVGPDGCVYTVSTSLSEVEGAFVWRACEEGDVEVVAELDHTGAPNDLAFDEDGNLFVTDPVLARIWLVSPEGDAGVFVQDALLDGDPADPALLFRALGVNGIAFDARERFLYVSNTDQGSIVRIRMRAPVPAPAVFVQDAALRGADGIAFDRSGTLFVAVNSQDSVVSVGRNRKLQVIGQGGLLDAPSSIVFGAKRRDGRQMFVTSSAFSRTLGLQPGTPAPALLKRRARVPGLPLP